MISWRLLSRAKMLDFIKELETKTSGARSLYLPPGLPQTEVETTLKKIAIGPDILPELSKIVVGSWTGAAIFWGPEARYIVLPPFPVSARLSANGLDTGPLQSLLERHRRMALVLVRLGAYAIGICDGEKLLSSKVGTGLVHGRHRQGGSSAHRFERHRDKQIEYFLTRVCQHTREQMEPIVKSLDYIVYGGARQTILLLQKQCPLLSKLATPALPPLLDIPDPRQAVLEQAVSRIWSSTVIECRED
jgi:hypothetical protein